MSVHPKTKTDEEIRAALGKGSWRIWCVQDEDKMLVLIERRGGALRIPHDQALRMLKDAPLMERARLNGKAPLQ